MERRIISLVVMEVDGNLSPLLHLVVVIRVFLEDGLFDRYLPCRIWDKSTPQRCDFLHQFLCPLIGINGTVAEMTHFIEIFIYFFFLFPLRENNSTHIYSIIWGEKKKNKKQKTKNFLCSLDTKRFNAFVAFYLTKYLNAFVESFRSSHNM